MITRLRSGITFFIHALCLAGAVHGQSFESGQKALAQNDFGKARDAFAKQFPKRMVAGYFGLALLQSKADANNKFYALDSAYYNICRAEDEFAKNEKDDREKLGSAGISFSKILGLQSEILQKAFDEAKQKNTVAVYDHFAETFLKSGEIGNAIKLRNQVAFEDAKAANTPMAFKAFLDKYPNASEAKDARKLYHTALFDSVGRLASPAAYQALIDKHADSPYRAQAEDSIYSISTKTRSVQAYLDFVNTYPRNRNTSKAWKQVYVMYTYDMMPATYEAFLEKYPDYPERSQVRRDMELVRQPMYRMFNGNAWGYVNELGAPVILFNFSQAADFSESYAAVQQRDKWYYIAKNSSTVLELEAEWAGSFEQGLAPVRKAGKFGMINKKGELQVQAIYDTITGVWYGLRMVRQGEKWGLLRADGKAHAPAEYEEVLPTAAGLLRIKRDGKFGYLDDSGSLVVAAEYDSATPYNQGVAVVKKADKYGLLNAAGQLVLPLEYDYIGTAAQGRVFVQKGKVAGYVKLDGKPLAPLAGVVSAQDQSFAFNRNMAPLRGPAKVGVIDTAGKWVLNPDHDHVQPITFRLLAAKQNGRWGTVDVKTKIFKPTDYDTMGVWQQGFLAVHKEDKWGYIDSNLKEVVSPNYDGAQPFTSIGYAIVGPEGRQSIINTKGEVMLPVEVERIEALSDRLVRLHRAGRTALFLAEPGKAKFLWKPPTF